MDIRSTAPAIGNEQPKELGVLEGKTKTRVRINPVEWGYSERDELRVRIMEEGKKPELCVVEIERAKED